MADCNTYANQRSETGLQSSTDDGGLRHLLPNHDHMQGCIDLQRQGVMGALDVDLRGGSLLQRAGQLDGQLRAECLSRLPANT